MVKKAIDLLFEIAGGLFPFACVFLGLNVLGCNIPYVADLHNNFLGGIVLLGSPLGAYAKDLLGKIF